MLELEGVVAMWKHGQYEAAPLVWHIAAAAYDAERDAAVRNRAEISRR